MSRIRADQFTNRLGTGAPELTYGASVPVGAAITGSGNINISGIVTATSFVGDGSGLVNVGIGTDGSINTTGIVTASYFYGDGRGLTNIGGTLDIINYSIPSGSTNVSPPTSVTFYFNKAITRGTGTIEIRSGSASGTLLTSYNVQTSTQVGIDGGALTLSYQFGYDTIHYVIIPANAIIDVQNTSANSLINTYNFTTSAAPGITTTVFAWGHNRYGDAGLGDEIRKSTPVQLPGTNWKEFASISHSCFGIRNDNTLWAWGLNPYGELGQNNQIRYDSPVQIPGNNWSSLLDSANATGNMASMHHMLAKKTDNTIWGWGYNGHGELGLNDTILRSSPVQIFGGETNWSDVAVGYHASYGIKNDSTLWSWGRNNTGQLGQNNTTNYSSPVQIPGTGWTTLRYLPYHSVAAKRNDALFVWGSNPHGNLGQNDTITRSSPVQIPGTNWDLETPYRHACSHNSMSFLKNDNTLWSWGYNGHGELGLLNNLQPRSSPIQVPGVSWKRIGGGYHQGFGINTSDQLWAWGYNSHGELGINDTIPRSSPVQVPGSGWAGIVASPDYTIIGIKTAIS